MKRTIFIIVAALIFTHTLSVNAATYGRSFMATTTAANSIVSLLSQWSAAAIWANNYVATSTTDFSQFVGGVKVGTMGNPAMTFTPTGTTALGIGTTSPWSTLSVNGSSDLGTSALAGFFTATTTATSTFVGGIKSPCFSTDGTNCITGGGSGVTGGTAGMLAAFSSATAITATGTPTAASYYATSTTATSTFNGALVVATSTSQKNDLSRSRTLTAWGDSLTYGFGVTHNTNDWPHLINPYLLVPFTVVNNYGISSEHTVTIKNRMINTPDRWGDFNVIWAGTNDILYSESTTTALANIQAMVDKLDSPKNYVVLSAFGDTSFTSGSGGYTTLISLNTAMAAAFPGHYIDMRAYIISQYDPGTPQDVIDHTNDIIPSTLRSDTIHLNAAGYRLVASRIAQYINSQNTENEVLSLNSGDAIGKLAANYSNITASSSIDANWFAGFESGNPWAIGLGGTNNYGIGSEAALTITTGDHNIFFGKQALGELTTGTGNIAMGYLNQYYNITNSNLISMGTSALYHMVTDGAIGIGYSAGGSMANGTFTGIGNCVFCQLLTTARGGNTGLGDHVGYYATTGGDNTYLGDAIGYLAGSTTASSLTTGSQNTFAGSHAGSVNNVSNAGAFGYNATTSLSNSVVLGNSYVTKGGIGTSTPSATWSVPGNLFWTASSTGMNGINLTGGCYAVNGTCIGGAGGSGTVNSGTTGQLPYYAANGTTLTATSTVFITTGGNVGIGTTTAPAKLTVDTGGASVIGQTIRGFNGQSASLQELQNATGTVLAKTTIIQSGGFDTAKLSLYTAESNTVSLDMYVGEDTLNTSDIAGYILAPGTGKRLFFGTTSRAPYQVDFSNVGVGGVTYGGVPTYYDTGGYDKIAAGSSGTGIIQFGYYGMEVKGDMAGTWSGTVSHYESASAASLMVVAGRSDGVGQIVYGKASQTADLMQFKNSAFTKLSVFNKDGWLGIGTSTPFTMLGVAGTITANNINATSTNATSTFSGDAVFGQNIKVGSGSLITNLDFGTYTPTLTNTTNVGASTARLSTWVRVGNTVTVSGQFDIDPAAPASATLMGVSLPVASNFSTAYQLGGTAYATAIASMGAGIEADATNDRASVKFVSSDINNQTMTFTFTYQVI